MKNNSFSSKSSITFIPVKKFLGREINCLLAKKKEGKRKMDGGRKGKEEEKKKIYSSIIN